MHTEKKTQKHVTLTIEYDLEIQWGSRGCRGTCSCRILSSYVQRFVSYRVDKRFAIFRNGEKS